MFRYSKKYPSRDTVPLNSISGERTIGSAAGAGEVPPHLPAHGAKPAAHLTAQRCKYKSPDIFVVLQNFRGTIAFRTQ